MASGFKSNVRIGALFFRAGPLLRIRAFVALPKLACLVLAVSIVAAAASGPFAVQAADPSQLDVTGVWRVDIEHQRRRCQWQGQVRLNQNGARLTGSGEAAAPSARRFCPRLKGDVEGSVNGRQVNFGFATGRLGTGEFEGAVADGGRMLSGTWSARSAAGTWQAELLDSTN
jgi:hypothetical protein